MKCEHFTTQQNSFFRLCFVFDFFVRNFKCGVNLSHAKPTQPTYFYAKPIFILRKCNMTHQNNAQRIKNGYRSKELNRTLAEKGDKHRLHHKFFRGIVIQ